MKKGLQIWKYRLLGSQWNDGLLAVIVVYSLLSVIAYLYLQPFFHMLSTSLMTLADLIDPTVKYIPREVTFQNISDAWTGLKYPKAFANTIVIALVCSILQVMVCSLTGYALARLHFPGKTLFTFLMILTFLVPSQVIIIPLYVIYSQLNWLNTPLVFLVPALLGQGLRSALFIIIFRQFFLSQPAAMEEAAKIDGAGTFRLFARIMLPLARPAAIVVFLFSFIWYWNMYYEPSMFMTGNNLPLSLRLNGLEAALVGDTPSWIGSQQAVKLHEGPKMAGALMIILPPLILYIFAQKWFVEGIDRAGLVE